MSTAPRPASRVPAAPEPGLDYRQEYYAGEAEDAATVLSLDEWVEVPAGSYRDVLMTKDYTPLHPEILEHKLYAKGRRPGARARHLRRRGPRGAAQLYP